VDSERGSLEMSGCFEICQENFKNGVNCGLTVDHNVAMTCIVFFVAYCSYTDAFVNCFFNMHYAVCVKHF